MKFIVSSLFALGLLAGTLPAADWVVYEGKDGPGKGKHIVLISGDEEYRSEEALPMLGKILSQRHGFKCTVLFPIDKATGEINPNEQTNIPGTEQVATADLVILALRFRELPDDQMKYLVDYLTAGKPLIALRTSTHAFNYTRNKQSPYARFDYASRAWPGGFGQQLLGETWLNHHGVHKGESARGVIEGLHAGHPILKGVKDIWGPSDVYGIKRVPPDAKVLMHGLTLKGMQSDSLPNYDKSLMPMIWFKDYQLEGGQKGIALTSTIGAAVDLESEDLRRLFANACYWLVGLQNEIPARADVNYVGEFKPTFFGFNAFVKGRRPADFDLKD
jgi:hypothetical protein